MNDRLPVANQDALRELYQPPTANVVAKDIGHIDEHFRRFIALSPFFCLGTAAPDGSADVSPRGGEPGFVHVLDQNTLAFPDRPGNNRVDSLTNIVARPGVGLMFLVPGFEDVLRVNGVARITADAALATRFSVGERAPLSVILVTVTEAYLHCAKAVRRANLWSPAAQVDRGSFPSAGRIYRDQLALTKEIAAIDEVLEKDARERLY